MPNNTRSKEKPREFRMGMGPFHPSHPSDPRGNCGGGQVDVSTDAANPIVVYQGSREKVAMPAAYLRVRADVSDELAPGEFACEQIEGETEIECIARCERELVQHVRAYWKDVVERHQGDAPRLSSKSGAWAGNGLSRSLPREMWESITRPMDPRMRVYEVSWNTAHRPHRHARTINLPLEAVFRALESPGTVVKLGDSKTAHRFVLVGKNASGHAGDLAVGNYNPEDGEGALIVIRTRYAVEVVRTGEDGKSKRATGYVRKPSGVVVDQCLTHFVDTFEADAGKRFANMIQNMHDRQQALARSE